MIVTRGAILEKLQQIFDNPRHPYTRALLASRPTAAQRSQRLASIDGSPPSLANLPVGCRFAERCEYAVERCELEYPRIEVIGPGHGAACWRAEEAPWASH